MDCLQNGAGSVAAIVALEAGPAEHFVASLAVRRQKMRWMGRTKHSNLFARRPLPVVIEGQDSVAACVRRLATSLAEKSMIL